MITSGTFAFIVDGKMITVFDYRDIPSEFEHVIKFAPDIPPGPHTAEEHAEIESLNGLFQQLIVKERQCQQ